MTTCYAHPPGQWRASTCSFMVSGLRASAVNWPLPDFVVLTRNRWLFHMSKCSGERRNCFGKCDAFLYEHFDYIFSAWWSFLSFFWTRQIQSLASYFLLCIVNVATDSRRVMSTSSEAFSCGLFNSSASKFLTSVDSRKILQFLYDGLALQHSLAQRCSVSFEVFTEVIIRTVFSGF
jgi:hypothetical protein